MAEGRSPADRVLVAILKDPQDWAIAQAQHWYRIPVASVEKSLQPHWPPAWIAFYQTKAFGAEAYAVRYYAAITDIARVQRCTLFPAAAPSPKSHVWYYKLTLGPLQRLERPIPSQTLRRVAFIPATWARLEAARDVSDLLKKPVE
ncbi:MAG: hypothetical protein Fur0046_39720 [Cyanobacteria bacterium J069]